MAITRIDEQTQATLQPWFSGLDMSAIRLVHTGPVCWYVRYIARQGAMTIAPFIFYGKESFQPGEVRSLALLAHELRHVEQYRRLGHPGFLLRYLLDLAGRRFRYAPDLPLEAECYALQREVREALTGRQL